MRIAALLLLLAPLALAQPATAPNSKMMELTMVATGKDNAPVEDLSITDIAIKDNGRKQTPISFEKIVAGKGATNGPDVHNFVLLDHVCCYSDDIPATRIAFLNILNDLAKAHNVTLFIRRFDFRVLSDPSQGERSLLARFAKSGFDPAKPELSNWVFDEIGIAPVFSPGDERTAMDIWLKGMQEITTAMRSHPGRKNFYWISKLFLLAMGETGATYYEDMAAQFDKKVSADRQPSANGQLIRAYAADLRRTAAALQDSGAAVYPLSGAVLWKGGYKRGAAEPMPDIAKATGGLAFGSPAEEGLRDALKDGQVCYLVRYQVSADMFDGKEHAIRIDTTRKNVNLRYRSSYVAPRKVK